MLIQLKRIAKLAEISFDSITHLVLVLSGGCSNCRDGI
jgi:hypothetical protein